MKRLIEIELLKLWRNRMSRILISAYFILLTSVALIASIKVDFAGIKFHLAEQGIFNFPFIWHFNTYTTSLFKLFLAIIIVSMVANEYSNRTLKQNLIDGMSKKEFLASKVLTILLFSVISTLFIFITSLILGLIYSSYTEISIIFSELEYLLAYFINHVAFFSFCLFLGVLIKRSAFALGALAVWSILEFIGFLTIKACYDGNAEATDQITQFFPVWSMSNLIDQPWTRLSAVKSLANQVGENFDFDYAIHSYEIGIVLVWTIIFIGASYKLLLRRDL